jgi:hypothetical protein
MRRKFDHQIPLLQGGALGAYQADVRLYDFTHGRNPFDLEVDNE